MQGPVSEEQYREFLKVFQSFHTPSDLAALPLMASPLIKQMRHQQPTLLPHQALQAVFSEIVAVLAAENQPYADLLQGRFWEGQSIEAMVAAERPLPMSKRTFSNYQRSAIQSFAFLFLQAEQHLQRQIAAAPASTPTTTTQVTAQATPVFVDPPVVQPDQTVQAKAGDNALGQPIGVTTATLHPRRFYWALGSGLLLASFLLIGVVAATPLGNWFGNAQPVLLFSDDFEAGATQWNAHSGAWTIEVDEGGNHFYCVTQTEPTYTYAVAGSTIGRITQSNSI